MEEAPVSSDIEAYVEQANPAESAPTRIQLIGLWKKAFNRRQPGSVTGERVTRAQVEEWLSSLITYVVVGQSPDLYLYSSAEELRKGNEAARSRAERRKGITVDGLESKLPATLSLSNFLKRQHQYSLAGFSRTKNVNVSDNQFSSDMRLGIQRWINTLPGYRCRPDEPTDIQLVTADTVEAAPSVRITDLKILSPVKITSSRFYQRYLDL